MAQVTSSWRQRAVKFVALLAALAPMCSSKAADTTLEYQVKATFLLNFTRFIEWPPGTLGGPDAPFNICILGNDPFGNVLEQIVTGELVSGRKVAIQKLDRDPQPGTCRIVFVGDQADGFRNPAGMGRGVLTVGEGEAFVRNGGMIGFVIENRRVIFDINRRAAEAAGLRFSSGLLSVAKSVIK
jgi:YfiR/HmsC-like